MWLRICAFFSGTTKGASQTQPQQWPSMNGRPRIVPHTNALPTSQKFFTGVTFLKLEAVDSHLVSRLHLPSEFNMLEKLMLYEAQKEPHVKVWTVSYFVDVLMCVFGLSVWMCFIFFLQLCMSLYVKFMHVLRGFGVQEIMLRNRHLGVSSTLNALPFYCIWNYACFNVYLSAFCTSTI